VNLKELVVRAEREKGASALRRSYLRMEMYIFVGNFDGNAPTAKMEIQRIVVDCGLFDGCDMCDTQCSHSSFAF
jgi:hypothetical protein